MRKLFLFLIVTGLTTASQAADVKNGAKLHAENCNKCHDSSIYTRSDRRVTSLPKLGSQVRVCKDIVGITWFDDEVEDVTEYLNQNYYHF